MVCAARFQCSESLELFTTGGECPNSLKGDLASDFWIKYIEYGQQVVDQLIRIPHFDSKLLIVEQLLRRSVDSPKCNKQTLLRTGDAPNYSKQLLYHIAANPGVICS